MSQPVGKKLAQARHKRGLSLDEAAHAIKLRPDRILALENDDLTSFPSNAYAKGFLKNYARYLEVDVDDFIRTIDSTLPITVAEYQYLTNAPEKPADDTPQHRERRPPSVIPLVAAAGALFLAVTGFWFYANAQRIFGEPDPQAKAAASKPASDPTPKLPAVAPDIALPSTLSLEPAPAFEPAAEMRPAATNDDHAVIKPTVTTDPVDHDVVTPVAVAAAEPGAALPAGMNEVLVASVKKTWITVRRDDPKAPPIFEDFLYPQTRPLKLRGARFFIEARDPSAVQITKNGLPIAYQAAGVPIQ